MIKIKTRITALRDFIENKGKARYWGLGGLAAITLGILIFARSLGAVVTPGDAVALGDGVPPASRVVAAEPVMVAVGFDDGDDHEPSDMVVLTEADMIYDPAQFALTKDLAVRAVNAAIEQSTDQGLLYELFAPADRPQIGLVIDPALTFELLRLGNVWPDEEQSEGNFARLWLYTEMQITENNHSDNVSATWIVEMTYEWDRWWVNRVSLREVW